MLVYFHKKAHHRPAFLISCHTNAAHYFSLAEWTHRSPFRKTAHHNTEQNRLSLAQIYDKRSIKHMSEMIH